MEYSPRLAPLSPPVRMVLDIQSTLQTRREKILEAKNKEMRLKEKTKVMLLHCWYEWIVTSYFRGYWDWVV